MAKAKNQPNFGMQWKKGGDFLSVFFKKYYLTIAWRKTPYIESEKRRTIKSFKKVDISVVLEIFVYPQKGTLPSRKRDTQNNNKEKRLEKSSPRIIY
ncbi:hypothetical protein ACQKFK_31590 [Bacillus mycoides]|uniref:hypothetical protein n=1 Tax=Bacillus mycoides TaxID=1405 RepID=UPI003CFEDF2C